MLFEQVLATSVMAFCCWSAKKPAEQQRSDRMKKEDSFKPRVPPESVDKKPAAEKPESPPRSASEPHKPRKSLDKPELSWKSSLSDSSSSYCTPLTSLHNVRALQCSQIRRMEKAEKERMKEHTEMKEMILEHSKSIEKLETEIKDKEKHETATPDREGQLKNTASQFPQNCSVSTDVLVGLAKHVT